MTSAEADEARSLNESFSEAHSSQRLLHSSTNGSEPADQTSASSQRGQRNGKNSLTFWNGLALVVSIQIGSGIFSAPWQVSNHVSSPGIGLTVWFFSGLFVWTGAASFIELGTAIPRNGGVQEYLRYCYGDLAGCLFTWTWVCIRKPAAMAVVSGVFADYICRVISGSSNTPGFLVKAVSVIGLAVITSINCLGAKSGALVANGFLVLKLLIICSIAILGITVAYARHGNLQPAGSQSGWFQKSPIPNKQGAWAAIGDYATAVFGATFSYGGWEAVGFVAGDLANASQDLPHVLHTAMVIVITGFTMLNVALYTIVPFDIVRSHSTPIMEFGRLTLGSWGAAVFSLVVSLSAIGTLNGNVFATARLCVAASQRRYFPGILANLHIDREDDESEYLARAMQRYPHFFRYPVTSFAERTERLRLREEVPIYAMLANFGLATIYVLLGSFDSLVTFMGLAEYSFFALAVSGIYVVRKCAQNPMGHRTWTMNPIIFCSLSTMLILRGVLTNPVQGLAIGILCLFCGLMYRYRRLGGSEEVEHGDPIL